MITSTPTAPDGSVTRLSFYEPSTFRPTDAILCRNFAPLVRLAFQLIRRGVPCRVLGTEFATQLETLIQSANASDIRSLQAWLAARRDRDIAEALKKQRPRSVQLAEEKYDCLIYLASQEPTVPSLLYTLRKLFDDKVKGLLTLSTIHKAKGLEWPRVFFLDVKLIPSRYATQPWEIAQETNLRYVGVTRAKLDLIYIESERWEGQEVESEID